MIVATSQYEGAIGNSGNGNWKRKMEVESETVKTYANEW